jgi:hypothetical protein
MFACSLLKAARVAGRAVQFTRIPGVLLALFVGPMVVAMPMGQAHAEIIKFWEDADKPDLTGRQANSAGKVARAARSAERNDGARSRRSSTNQRVASRGRSDEGFNPTRGSLSGGGSVSWSAPSGCLNGTLSSALRDVASSYGPVTVTSTCRSKTRNASVGGAKKSHHLTGDAADFRVRGNPSSVMAALRSNGSIGGVKHYGGGLYHIDTGPRRTW